MSRVYLVTDEFTILINWINDGRFETSITIYQSTRRDIPEGLSLVSTAGITARIPLNSKFTTECLSRNKELQCCW